MMLGLGSLIPDMAWGEGQDELLGGPAFGDIVRAVEWQESRGRDDAVSPKGAYGAMQLMPGAVVDYARAHGLPTDPQTIETLRRDPKRNREIGAWYLQQVQDQFGGEMVPALAAYNAGPGRVKRILAGFGGKYSPQIEADFIAQLPAETRDYIAKIKGRLGDAGPSQEAAPMPYEMMGRPPTPEELAARARITSNPSVQDGIERDWQPEMRSGGPRGAGISALGARPQAQGLSGINPYLQIASQLMPERQGRPWADALINAGAAMMQSNRPDFLGGVGAGLQAANQSMARDEEQRYRDQVGTLDLGIKMAQLGQKEAKQPLIKEFKEGDRIVTKQWNGAMWVPLADAPANAPPPGFTRGPDGGLVGDPAYLAAQEQIRRAGKTEVTNTVDMKGQTAGAQEAAKLDAKKLDGFRSQGDTAASTIDDINMVESWLSGLDTGTLAPEKLAAQKFLGGLGINLNIFGTQEQVGKAEAATTIVNQMALKLRNPESGLGMPGAMSDKDLAFLKQSVVGLETGPIGRKLIIDLTRRAANRRMEVARLADEYYYQNDNSFKGWSAYLKEWRDANPLFSEADVEAAKAAKAAATSGGATPAPAPAPPPPAPPPFPSSLNVTTPNADGTTKTEKTQVPVTINRASIAPQIKMMDLKTLQQLAPDQLSEEERKAAADRWEELNRGGR